jgi:catechol 2,3-dioxygenase-like lactoylglutathione lyase family enzyme
VAWSSRELQAKQFAVTLSARRVEMSNFIQITPFMVIDDVERALAFFTGILGFEILFRQSNYAYIEREGVGFRLLEEKGADGAPPGNRRFAYYIDVRDVDQLYAELKPKLDTLPERDVYGPINQPYGQRELLVLAPDGNLIAFGQAISASTEKSET